MLAPDLKQSFDLLLTLVATACAIEGAADAQPPRTPSLEVVARPPAAVMKHARSDPSVASSVLEAEALTQVGRSTGDVLARVPGVQVTRTGAQSDVTTASIRGADASQVPVYLAGIRLNDEVLGGADLSSIPLFLMRRVEVYRGNSPELSDRMGPGGAILFWPRLPRQTELSAGGEFGSFGQRAAWASLEAGTEQSAVLGAVRFSGASNDYPFLDDQGQRFDLEETTQRRQNADYAQRDFWLIQRYRWGRATLRAVLHGLTREQGVTGLSVRPATRTRSQRGRYLGGISARLPCGPQRCTLTLDTTLLVARQTLTDPLVELPSLRTRRLHAGAERGSQAVRLSLRPGEALHLSLSALVSADSLRVDREGGDPRRGRRRTLLPKLRADWDVTDRLGLHGLAALECHQTRGVTVRLQRRVVLGGNAACDVREPVGRIGAQWSLSDELSLLSNLGRHVRVPTLSELYGTSDLVDGNPTLEPERGWSWDVGTRLSHAGAWTWTAEAFGFHRLVDDLIRFRRSGVDSLAAFNVASAAVTGLEWSVASSSPHGLTLQSTGTWLRARETTDDPVLDPTDNDALPNTAPLTMTLSASQRAELRSWGALFDHATLHVSYLYRAERFNDSAGLHRLAPQHFLDAGLRLSTLMPRIEVSFAIRNLADSRSSDLIGLPVPGRAAHARLQAWY